MGKSFQFNNRKETEKTEDVINTLVSPTLPLTSTYDDANNTLTLSVNTGKDANELLKVGSIEINGVLKSEITSGQLLIMNGEEVIGKTIGNLQSNILQNGADLTSGHILKMSSSQVVGEATGVSQDNILVSGGNIANNDYLYNDDGVIKGRTPQVVLGNLITDAVNETDGLFLKKMMLGSSSGSSNNGIVPLYINYGVSPDIPSNSNTFYRQFSNTTGNKLKGKGDLPDNGATFRGDQECSIYASKNIITDEYFVAINGTFNSSSDDRIKSEETPIENATATLLQITPKNYFKHPEYRVDEDNESPIPEKDASGIVIKKQWESGVIAQEVLIIPELEHLINEHINPINSQDTLTMNYTGLIPFLVKSVQELNQRIVELESNS